MKLPAFYIPNFLFISFSLYQSWVQNDSSLLVYATLALFVVPPRVYVRIAAHSHHMIIPTSNLNDFDLIHPNDLIWLQTVLHISLPKHTDIRPLTESVVTPSVNLPFLAQGSAEIAAAVD